MNSSNETSTSSSSSASFPPMLIAFMSLQQIVCVVSLTGNGIVLVIFTRFMKLKSSNKYVISLAVADFFTGIATGLQIYYLLFRNLSTIAILCIPRYELIDYSTLVQQLTVCLSAFDRFIAVCHPHKYASIITRFTSNIITFAPWVIFSYKILIPLAMLPGIVPGTRCSSTLFFSVTERGLSAIYIFVSSFITFAFYVKILRVAWRFHNKIGPKQNADDSRSKTIAKDIMRAKVTGIVALAFSICWLPYSAFRIRDMVIDSSRSSLEQTISNWLVFLGIFNCLANPFIYAWKRPDFREQCQNLFTCNRR